jgi:hypothetical protein
MKLIKQKSVCNEIEFFCDKWIDVDKMRYQVRDQIYHLIIDSCVDIIGQYTLVLEQKIYEINREQS